MFKKKYLIIFLIILFVLFFSFFKYFSIISKTNGIYLFPTDDTYITLSYSFQMGKGFPFQFNDGEPPAPMEPSFLSQLVYSIFYKIGIRSSENFSVFTFWLNIFLMGFTLILIFYIFIYLTDDLFISLISLILTFLYTPFRYIFTLAMGHSFLTFFFYLTFLFLLKRKLLFFAISGIFLAFSRPESIFIILIFLIYFLIKKDYKFTLISLILFIICFAPSFIYLIYCGEFFPTGLYPQSLFLYYSLPAILGYTVEYFNEYFKGILLGLYNSSLEKWYLDFYYAQIPFGLFLFSLIPLFKRETYSLKFKEIIYLFLPLFLINLFLSSFTLYKGVHLLRHTVWLFPFFFLFIVTGVEFINKKINIKYLNYAIYVFYSFYLLGISIDFENKNVLTSIHKSYPHYIASQWIKNNIKDGEFLAITPSRLKFFSQKRIYSFSPGINWRISKYSRFRFPSHYFEFLKYEILKNKDYFTYWDIYDEEIPIFEYFKFLVKEIIYEQRFLSGNYIKIGKVDKDLILNSEKPLSENMYFKIIHHIDIGDPILEKIYDYSFYLYEPLIKARPFPIKGELEGKKIIEGGIFSIKEKFVFEVKDEDLKDSLFLIGRFAKKIYYSITFHKNLFSNFVELPIQKVDIYINNKFYSYVELKDIKDFMEFKLYLPSNFLKSGKNTIVIFNPHISTSYWIVKR
ncbi:MAG: hypothetical protein ABIM36_02855 [candidate division WOR-3 bacterium]